ncbi:hypothetical protein J22TS1_29290 [Siminovitchia terrae]|uniref:hypothetical protein n=1 Tax=Siminovitchia terrae TaxID=1914933 RepID=UPI001B13BCF6|nr:hypothetical protein [Siminovitchia terrae]GIN91878.1 hypothetical protein J22TS1_29290 [Siminovitchia terrae]
MAKIIPFRTREEWEKEKQEKEKQEKVWAEWEDWIEWEKANAEYLNEDGEIVDPSKK